MLNFEDVLEGFKILIRLTPLFLRILAWKHHISFEISCSDTSGYVFFFAVDIHVVIITGVHQPPKECQTINSIDSHACCASFYIMAYSNSSAIPAYVTFETLSVSLSDEAANGLGMRLSIIP